MSPWSLDPRSFTAWNIETAGATIRIVEATGYRRITEQGNIRIIESKPFRWNQESNSFTTWTSPV